MLSPGGAERANEEEAKIAHGMLLFARATWFVRFAERTGFYSARGRVSPTYYRAILRNLS
jgi:hypothetical protein